MIVSLVMTDHWLIAYVLKYNEVDSQGLTLAVVAQNSAVVNVVSEC